MLREKITDEEYEALHDYRENWAYQSDNPDYSLQVPIKEVLFEWEEEKVNLFHLLGDNLILTKEVNYSSSISEKKRELDYFLFSYRGTKYNSEIFLKAYQDWVDDYISGCCDSNRIRAFHLVSYDVLLNNAWDWDEIFEVPMPNGKVYKITKGTKAAKALFKIASAYNLKGFEEFRLGHSLILNDKNLKGKLSISIHPLDYWTMSDNECNWTSCMSWEDMGGYRQGTVEMMNSPYVIAAYLSAETPYQMTDKFKWNNKKWRQLFIVNKDIICAVKGYPYQQEFLTEKIISWIAELAKENLGWEYDNLFSYYSNHTIYNKATDALMYENIYFTTNYMYNDIGTLERHLCLCAKDGISDDLKHLSYSGSSQCVCCGSINGGFSNENLLACSDCDHLIRCSECGEVIWGDEYSIVKDNILCSTCTDDLTFYCSYCGDYDWNDNQTTLTIIVNHIESEDTVWIFNENLTLCQDCYEQLVKKVPIYTDGCEKFVIYQDLAESAVEYLPWLLKDRSDKPYLTFEELKKNCPYSILPQNLLYDLELV